MLRGKATNTNFMVFGLTAHEASTLTITPSMQFKNDNELQYRYIKNVK
jgi:hypothetical protein